MPKNFAAKQGGTLTNPPFENNATGFNLNKRKNDFTNPKNILNK